MGVIVLSSRGHWSARENFGGTWESHPTNAGIPNKLSKMAGFIWICVWRTADNILDSPNVPEQWITLHSKYNAWNIIHYHFLIILILAIIIFNIQFFASLLKKSKKMVRDSNISVGIPK